MIKNKLGMPFTPYREFKGYPKNINALLWRTINGIREGCVCIYKEKSSGISSLAMSRAQFHASCQGDDQSNWTNYTHWDNY